VVNAKGVYVQFNQEADRSLLHSPSTRLYTRVVYHENCKVFVT